jgi:hypothetical protein
VQNNERPSKLPTQASLQQPANLSSKVKKSSSGVKIALLSLLSLASIVVIVLALPNLLRQNNGGSTSTNLDRQRTLSSLATGSISNTTWKDQTLALLEKTHAWSGSYTGNLATASSAYDSYTTYYTVLAYKELGSPIPNADATVKAIKASQGTDGSFLCEKPTVGKTEPQIDRIGCIHYAVMTLDALGTRPNDVQAVIQHINALQSNAGVYAFNTDVLNQINASSPDINRDILATRQALTVLETLGGQPQRSESLKKLATLAVEQRCAFTEAVSHKQKLSTLLGVGESLERLAMKLRDLSNAPARLTWAKSLRGTVLDLRAGGQKTNLMLIADWLDLTQRLSGDEKNGNLLDATSLTN